MEQENMVEGLDIDKSSSRDYFCDTCIRAKQTVSLFPKESLLEYTRIGDLIVTDIWGQAQVQSLQGSKYFPTRRQILCFVH